MKFRVLSRANAIKFAKEPHDYKTIIISISNSYEYNWLTIYIKCFTNEEGITIEEPQYGWDGFDETFWKEACEVGIPMIKEIVGDLTFDEIYDKYCKLTKKEQEDEEYINECLRHGFKALNVKHFY